MRRTGGHGGFCFWRPGASFKLWFVLAMALLGASCGLRSEPLGAGLSDGDIEGSSTSETVEAAESSSPFNTEIDTNVVTPSNVDLADTGAAAEPPTPESRSIHVDQFGYPTNAPKVAVLSSPDIGFNSERAYEPGAQLEVRRVSDDAVVFAGSPTPWGDGQVHDQSGDRGWWFDFSAVNEDGTYYVSDPTTGESSAEFAIGEDVYEDVLDAALKVFWFNRGNTDHPEELAGPWSDTAAYVGPEQDTEARSVDSPDDLSLARDLSGGWFDAGDTNKYVTFAAEPVHLLLTAYGTHPEVFDDALGITESGNGIPDVVDEVRWEVDWLKKMQNPDGGVLTKVGLLDFGVASPPSSHRSPRFYEEACSSATITAAGMFAHAALIFEGLEGVGDDTEELRERAIAAWDWYQENPVRDDCDPQLVKAGDADLSIAEQGQAEVVAAVYLFALTGEARFDASVQRGFDSLNPFLQPSFSMYSPHHGDALLYYRDLPAASAAVVRSIDDRIDELLIDSALYGFDDTDLYRSYMPSESYHWGSNRVKANIGISGLMIDRRAEAFERSIGHLNYFHGVNPLGTSYLSNSTLLGAETSVERILHYWFGKGSLYDIDVNRDGFGAPPGYVVGGPNAAYSGLATPPLGQPPQKSYRDFSDSTEPTWELTEPAIYYQASYVRLLVEVVAASIEEA